MTFNVRGFTTPVDGRHRWPRRAARNVATVREQAPDVLGVQELQRAALATYRRELPDHGLVLGPAAGTRRRPEHNAILYAPDRLELLDHGGFWLSATPDVPSASWGTRNARALNWATFAVRGTGATFRHVNVHLDHWSSRAREESVRLFLRRLDDGAPTVVTGDFNCPPGSPPYRALLGHGYDDTCLQDEETFHGFGTVRAAVVRRFHRGPLRLDWILAERGRWEVEGSRIVRGTGASDHDPVVADLLLSGS
ncbi:endonuclease/exonuclease/phosphatase family metal-dependent hydrolase [Actinomycetospora succinea]|uniref:Endonuclease/exonuclease/phosphatase family metal-dependent hydrolase n=1 Tax=Actinomycetospora succinea TaxID=663603 RepID=A0A4R6UY49_9PSEU|nr:endonuclease/exonuclease/phosphatase family protein [Actinomycetospora succinea]TDQ50863.1 endonuclease/exonuclease/phosphatase family metal-dependent hydrolase [Actinomycetospora succinea]